MQYEMDAEGGVLTKGGYDLIGKILAGESSLHLTNAKVGSGILKSDEDPADRTDLVFPEINAAITGLHSAEGGEAVISIQVSSMEVTTGFFLTEAGIWAQDTDGTILYTYIYLNKPIWIRPKSHTVGNVVDFHICIVVGKIQNISINLSPAGLVTIPELDRRLRPIEADFELATIWHGLGSYPQVLLCRVQNGLGVAGLGLAPLGGADTVQHAARAVYHDPQSLTLYTTKPIVSLGSQPPALHRHSGREYFITWPDNALDSLYIRLL